MTQADAPSLLRIWGDDEAMRYYPAPKTRAELATWIELMHERYERDGIGLWIIETQDGEFIGDCGLTWQRVNGRDMLEVGFHTLPAEQGNGFATEAAEACVAEARRRFAPIELTAIIHPDNVASRRVAEKLGMTYTEDDHDHPWIVRTVMSMSLTAP